MNRSGKNLNWRPTVAVGIAVMAIGGIIAGYFFISKPAARENSGAVTAGEISAPGLAPRGPWTDNETAEAITARVGEFDEEQCRRTVRDLFAEATEHLTEGRDSEAIITYERCFRYNTACLEKIARALDEDAHSLRTEGKQREARELQRQREALLWSHFIPEQRAFLKDELSPRIKQLMKQLVNRYQTSNSDDDLSLVRRALFVTEHISKGCH